MINRFAVANYSICSVKFILFTVLGLVVLALLSCGEDKTSELQLTIITPSAPSQPNQETDTVVTQLRVHMPGAGIDRRFVVTGRKTVVTLDEIPTGTHSITAELLNAEGTVRFRGQSSVTISDGVSQIDLRLEATADREFTADLVVTNKTKTPKVGDRSTIFSASVTAKDSHFAQDAFDYQWDWGDGTVIPFGKSDQLQHRYRKQGTFNIKVVVKSGDGATVERTTMVVIEDNSKLRLRPEELHFSDDGTDKITLDIGNEGTGVIEWRIKDIPKWLKFSKENGSVMGGGSNEVVVTADKDDLWGGADFAEVEIDMGEDFAETLGIYAVKDARETNLEFSEDFSDGVANGWQPKMGQWEVTDGGYRAKTAHDDTLTVFGEDNWRDITFEARLKLPDDLNQSYSSAKVFLRCDQETMSGVCLSFDWSNNRKPCYSLYIFKNGREIYNNDGGSCWIHSRNGWMSVKVEVIGEMVTTAVNGGTWESMNMMSDPVYNARSSGQLPVTGGIGLNCWAGDRGGNTNGILWDDIKITVHSIID